MLSNKLDNKYYFIQFLQKEMTEREKYLLLVKGGMKK